MYEFRDVNDSIEYEGSEGISLPSEAMQINGEYIETLIDGYRTLTVSGREALSPEVTTYEVGASDGSRFDRKRYPERIITVEYQLLTSSPTVFREAYNKLAEILDVEDAQLIFDDEADKYFIGTPSFIGNIEPGRNNVVGTFEIKCADPFKYSLVEYEVVPDDYEGDASVLIDYNGTYKSYPKLCAEFYSEEETSEDGETDDTLTGDGDCGFVAFFNEDEKIIQIGDPEESDTLLKSQTLINQTFKKSTSWGTAARGKWTANGGYVPSTLSKLGSVSMGKIGTSSYYLHPSAFGSHSGWHGPTISRAIPADSQSQLGAKTFTCTFKLRMSIGGTKKEIQANKDLQQKGAFQVQFTDSSNANVLGVRIVKSTTGKRANVYFYIGGAIQEKVSISLTSNNRYFSATGKQTCKITKAGSTITFNMGGLVRKYVEDDLEDTVVRRITMAFEKTGTKPTLEYNGITSVKFVKHNVDTLKDIPNKFGTDDVLECNCRTGEILLNDISSPDLGALGNDWEDFYLKPGLNLIDCAYSDWVEDEYAPQFKILYREVFL